MFCAFAVWGYILVTILYICCAGLGLHPGDCFVHCCCAGLGLLLHAGECFVRCCCAGLGYPYAICYPTYMMKPVYIDQKRCADLMYPGDCFVHLLCRFGVPICSALPHVHKPAPAPQHQHTGGQVSLAPTHLPPAIAAVSILPPFNVM